MVLIFAKYVIFYLESILLQFKRLVNVYFLVIIILLFIPQISPLEPIAAFVPLLVVITISVIREGFEDYQRYKSDQKLNHELRAEILTPELTIKNVEWREVIVGDIVKLKKDDLIPADLILLSSPHDGVAFLETASLDGERALKPRKAFPTTNKFK